MEKQLKQLKCLSEFTASRASDGIWNARVWYADMYRFNVLPLPFGKQVYEGVKKEMEV